MCGIVGYVGKEQAAPILLEGLGKLEYRGYDSAGIAVYNGSKIDTMKATGKLSALFSLTQGGELLPGTIGIGHTRWATHGSPTEINAHPHLNESGSIVVVHNGIIENYAELRDRLLKKGYQFRSETDTEVVAHLLDYYYKGDPLEAIEKIIHHIEGSYAFGILFDAHPGELYAVRKESPLIVGSSKEGNFIASDVPAILKYTRDVFYIDNGEIAKLTEDGISFYNTDGETITKESTRIQWDMEAAEKGGYAHFMLKEMYEQPKAVADTLAPYVKGDSITIESLGLTEEEIKSFRKIHIVACGSAYHSGVTAKYVFEGLARIPVEVDLASEFRYRNPILDKDTLVIIISQSGETADSKAALLEAKRHNVKVLAIVNVVGSAIAREADIVMYTLAGPEIAVATTKAYSTQLICQYILALKFAEIRGTISEDQLHSMIKDLKRLPDQIELLLNNKEKIQRFANRYLAAEHVFFIGRGIDYAISLEASLKLKEISYIHSEAYAAGELKHGTISLIEDGTLVVALLTQEDLFKKTISNIEEVRTRGAFVLTVTNEGHPEAENCSDYTITIPQTNHYFANSLAIIPLQLFGYYVSIGKGFDADKPRNLAKSVTVE